IDSYGDTITYLKNTSNYVVIRIDGAADVNIECYNDRKGSTPQCITGDCGNYAGQLRFFSEDTYTGTFIDGSLSGFGTATWYASKNRYEGSFIDSQLAGYGTLYDANDKILKQGFFFKGDTATFIRNKEGCQLGNCQDGFGAKMISGDVYI